MDRDLIELAPILNWVDSKYGPILRIRGLRPSQPEPDWWLYTCDVARTTGRHFLLESNNSQGTSVSQGEAMGKALAEAVERYCLANWSANAERCAMSMGDSPFYSRLPRCADFENAPSGLKGVSEGVRITHCLMNELGSDRKVPVPAGFVLPRFVPPAGEPQVAIATSSGAAFHTNLPSAILAGLCEAAERDAAMDFWLHSKAVPRIKFESRQTPYHLADRLQRLEKCSIRPFLFDITSDFPFPVVLCVLASQKYPYWSFGTACNTNFSKACARAIDESVAVRFKQLYSARKSEVVSRQDFSWVKHFAHHAELYAGWYECPVLKFLMEPAREVSYSDIAERYRCEFSVDMDSLRALSQRLSKAGLTVLWADTSTDDARQFGTSVKVMVPEMIPLSCDFSARWLATKRLNRDQNLNVTEPNRFNPYPHPFG